MQGSGLVASGRSSLVVVVGLGVVETLLPLESVGGLVVVSAEHVTVDFAVVLRSAPVDGAADGLPIVLRIGVSPSFSGIDDPLHRRLGATRMAVWRSLELLSVGGVELLREDVCAVPV